MKQKYYLITLAFVAGILLQCCTKIEYHEVESPAYLRVFNNLNYEVNLGDKELLVPYLTMLIDPEFDQNGVPVSAAIVGDFLDKRVRYAAPYPTHSAGSTKRNNPEYPGKENVLVGPILNGFDLSSWAQIPSGSHRVVFYFRPVNEIPFFQLTDDLKQHVAAEGTYDLKEREIYTLHVVQKDFETKENGLLLRQERFQHLPFSDSLVYVNFYNMSAKGFLDSEDRKPAGMTTLKDGMKDEMNVYLSLYPEETTSYNGSTALPGFYARYLQPIYRNTEEATVSPYFSFPLFADTSKTITTNMVQHVTFLAPGLNFIDIGIGGTNMPRGLCSHLTFYGLNELVALPARSVNSARFPSMFINTHSGIHNPKSFPTINTIEVVNGEAYLTTIQRKFDPPIYK
ncbi:hypothetical protein CHU00_06615 [Sphingobacterium cellulitidis]|uniref:hypothetical protein n=1 Tax=Sphingobacterium cellulitidis TaxID=1768011 RepID=UPI000B93AB24|nr:hypothetical protein [Sphingobacterium cellulitidis]OYD46357.1 hypothetical protein CHU00_06615 [Sphingobacterium cellulitidis]